MDKLVKRGSKYSDEDRRRAVVEYFVAGNMTLVAERTDIPRTTLNGWRQTEWWDEALVELRQEKADELDANLTKLIDSAFEQLQDRIEHGDYILNKEGKLVRKPMSGRDLVTTGAIVYDKQRLHRNQPTAIQGKAENLEALKEKFAQIERDYQIRKVNSIPGEFEEV
jgi:hypothetical protein